MGSKTGKTSNTNGSKLSVKVSEKGAVSIYGLRRFPITFYASEWEALFNAKDGIEKFIAANRAALKDKESSGGPSGTTAL